MAGPAHPLLVIEALGRHVRHRAVTQRHVYVGDFEVEAGVGDIEALQAQRTRQHGTAPRARIRTRRFVTIATAARRVGF